MEIGSKLKQLRLQLDLTQEELANRTELTKGYISQLENDLCSPSIATLKVVLDALGVSLSEFFAQTTEEKVVFTPNDYLQSTNGDCEVTWLVANSQKNEMEQIILTLPTGGQSEVRLPFEGEEFGYVLNGKIAIILGNKHYPCKKGEAFYYSANKPHSILNKGKGKAKFLWISTPPNF